ncbi:hypothetical protein [Fodinicurvata sp. EGI_FJ10296]|uniref:hypothetical protein n=1 Tax=Fodinicurvata sp. EGI_FJ10296 TaxID=3231908 RepID=UPI0034571E0E
MDDRDGKPSASANCRPPRILVAASLAVGFAFVAQEVVVFAGQPWSIASAGMVASYLIVAFVRVAGYFAAPFMIGRGQWLSFMAGLLLAPALASWVLMFLPAAFGDPVVAALAAISGVVLLALYVMIFRHFVIEFLDNRHVGPGKPPGDRR